MSSPSREDVVTEVEQLLEQLERKHAEAGQLAIKILQQEKLKAKVAELQAKDKEMRKRLDQLKSDGKWVLSRLKNRAESFKQARFEDSLHWLVVMRGEESLDRLRSISPDHKEALYSLEREALAKELAEANESRQSLQQRFDDAASVQNQTESKVAGLIDEVEDLVRETAEKDERISVLESELGDEKAGREGTEQRLLEAESEVQKMSDANEGLKRELTEATEAYMLREKAQDDSLALKDAELEQSKKDLEQKTAELTVAKGACAQRDAELKQSRQDLEQTTAELTAAKGACAQKDTELKQSRRDLEQKTAELKQSRQDLEQTTAELTAAKGACTQRDAELEQSRQDLEQKTAELTVAKGACAQRDAELEQSRQDLEQTTAELTAAKVACAQNDADRVQRDAGLAAFFMGPRHGAQDIDRWLPFVGSLEQPMPGTRAPVEQHPRWTVVQQAASPTGLLESVALLYGEAVADRYDEDGCAAFVPVIRGLEGAEVAPVPTIIQLLRRLLANTNQDGGHATQLGFFLGTWQVVCLVRLRWPETEGLADVERQCREKCERSPADFQLIRDLVAGVGSDRKLRTAFDGDQEAEIPPALLTTPHKYCPDQATLLVAPAATSSVWALDLRHCAIWLVDKDKGDFDDDGSYRLRGSQGREDLMVPSATSDLDFIFDHL